MLKSRAINHEATLSFKAPNWGLNLTNVAAYGSGEVQNIDGYEGPRVYLDKLKTIMPSHPVQMKRLDYFYSPCYFNEWNITVSGALAAYVGPGQGGRNYSASLAIGETPAALVDHATIALWAEVNSSSWEGGVFLAELADVVSMFVNPFKALAKACKNWEKTSRRLRKLSKSPKSYLTALSDSWLQYRYGIMPLVADVESIRALYDDTLRKSGFMTSRKGNRNNSEPIVTQFIGNAFSGVVHCLVEECISAKTICSGKMLYTIDESRDTELHRMGLSYSNLIPGLWELVPFSFIGDWFLNTGDWLQALNPRPGLNVWDSCLSIKREKTITWSVLGWGANPAGFYVGYHLRSGGGQATWRYATLDRIPLPQIPATPQLNPSFYKWKRALDSASLAWNLNPLKYFKRK